VTFVVEKGFFQLFFAYCGINQNLDMNITQTYLKDLSYKINGAAIEVHRELGPGLNEEVYHQCLNHELELRGMQFRSKLRVPVVYKGIRIETTLQCDILVEELICVELKAVKEIMPIHTAQLLTYMKLLEVPKGILYNFNVVNLYHEGQHSYVNNYFDMLGL